MKTPLFFCSLNTIISRQDKDMAFEVSRINRTSPQKFKLFALRRKDVESSSVGKLI